MARARPHGSVRSLGVKFIFSVGRDKTSLAAEISQLETLLLEQSRDQHFKMPDPAVAMAFAQVLERGVGNPVDGIEGAEPLRLWNKFSWMAQARPPAPVRLVGMTANAGGQEIRLDRAERFKKLPPVAGKPHVELDEPVMFILVLIRKKVQQRKMRAAGNK